MDGAHRAPRNRHTILLERPVSRVDSRQLNLLRVGQPGKDSWNGACKQRFAFTRWANKKQVVATGSRYAGGIFCFLLPANSAEVNRLGDQVIEFDSVLEC